jgi:phage gp16-like protein
MSWRISCVNLTTFNTNYPKKMNIESRRKGLLAKIHIAKSQLGLNDDEYRDFLESLTNLRSCADMSISQMEAVIQSMFRLGFKPKSVNPAHSPPTSHKADPSQTDKIRAMWIDLGKRGIVRTPTEPALRKFIKRITKVDSIEWLSIDESSAVIAALGEMGKKNDRIGL